MGDEYTYQYINCRKEYSIKCLHRKGITHYLYLFLSGHNKKNNK